MQPQPIEGEGPDRPPAPEHPRSPEAAGGSSLLDAALHALPVGLAVHDGDGRCVLANAAARLLAPSSAADQGDAPRETDSEPRVAQCEGCTVETFVQPFHAGTERYTLTTLVDVTRQHRVQRDLLRRAYIDALTGLPNRALLEQTVDDLIGSATVGDTFALAFIDLDNFSSSRSFVRVSHACLVLQEKAKSFL